MADERAPRDGRFIEKVGTYNPLLPADNAERVKLDLERIQHWLSKGAQPTDRVLRFLDQAGVLKREARLNPEKAEARQEGAGARRGAREEEGRGEKRRGRAQRPADDRRLELAIEASGATGECRRTAQAFHRWQLERHRAVSPVLLATIGAAHGVRGEVRVKSFAADPMALADYGPLFAEDGRSFEIERLRPAEGTC